MFVLLMVVITVCLFIIDLWYEERKGDGEVSLMISGIFASFTGVVAIVFLILYTAAFETYADLIAYEKVLPYYEEVIQRTSDAVVNLDQEGSTDISTLDVETLVKLGVSIENFKHSTLTAERILAWGTYNKEYLEELTYYRIADNNWFLRSFIPDLPEELKD